MKLLLLMILSLSSVFTAFASEPVKSASSTSRATYFPWTDTVTIQYYIASDPSPDWQDHRIEIRRAFAEWQRRTGIKFVEIGAANQPKTIDIKWVDGDADMLDPGILARTNYPPPGDIEPVAGDIRLNLRSTISINPEDGFGADLYSILIHEIGHAIGLPHSNSITSVMNAFYHVIYRLDNETVWLARALYGLG